MDAMTVPPNEIDREQTVLGGILIDPDSIGRVAPILQPEDFYLTVHQIIYRTMLTVAGADEPTDCMNIYYAAQKAEELEEIGGLEYITSLEHCVMSTANDVFHAKKLRAVAEQRRLLNTSRDSMETLVQGSDEDIAAASRRLREGAEKLDATMADTSHDVAGDLDAEMAAIEQRKISSAPITGVATGLDALDKMTLGWQRGDLILVAARPSIGKTALALHFASLGRVRTLFFSMEMSTRSIQQRLLAMVGKVDMQKIRNGYLSDYDMLQLREAQEKLKNLPLHIVTRVRASQEILATAQSFAAEFEDLGLIVVDYLQLASGSRESRRDSRNREMGEISADMKHLAVAADVPVIALSQLSRNKEWRGKRSMPRLSDLRDSGSLEQDADVVLFPHRIMDTEPESLNTYARVALMLEKQRNGPTGFAECWLHRPTTRFLASPMTEWDKAYWSEKGKGN